MLKIQKGASKNVVLHGENCTNNSAIISLSGVKDLNKNRYYLGFCLHRKLLKKLVRIQETIILLYKSGEIIMK